MTIRITYDGKDIDLPVGEKGLSVNYTHKRNQNRSGSGLIETISLYGLREMSFHSFFKEAEYFKLIAWWSWARQGKAWSLAMDSTETGDTTLDAAAAAGQKVIPLTATASFSVGDNCYIRNSKDDSFEVIEIDSISAGVSVTAVDNLKHDYVSGDYFTHLEYFPEVVSLDEVFNPDQAGKWYSNVFKFAEKK